MNDRHTATSRPPSEFGVGETARSSFAIPSAPPKRLHHWSRYVDIMRDRRIVYAYESTGIG